MAGFQLVGFGSFLLVSFVVGVRLLRLWRRTRELPELSMAIALLCTGVLGYGLTMAARFTPEASPARPVLWIGGLVSMSVGAAALYLFTWWVFFRASRAAAAIAAGGCLAMIAGFVGIAASTGFVHVGLLGTWSYVGFSGRSGSFAFAAVATFHYWAKLRRRARIGLADPLVTQCFLLWGIAATAALGTFLLNLALSLAGVHDPSSPVSLTGVPVLGLVAALAVWLAFFPPPTYRRRFARPGARAV